LGNSQGIRGIDSKGQAGFSQHRTAHWQGLSRRELEKHHDAPDYSVAAARSGDEALSLFEANPTFDLLFTDIMMPRTLMGAELRKAVRKKGQIFRLFSCPGTRTMQQVAAMGGHKPQNTHAECKCSDWQ